MSSRRSEEIRREAVRIALSSGVPRHQVAPDLGVGHSTPNKWVQRH